MVNLMTSSVSPDNQTIGKNAQGQLEVKDSGLTPEKFSSDIGYISKEKKFITSIYGTASTIPYYFALSPSDSSLTDNQVSFTISDAGNDNDTSTYVDGAVVSGGGEGFW